VAAALKQRPETSIVSAVHHDTPSGTLNPIREIGRVVRDHGALLLVDAVSSFAGMDIHPDDCHADIFVTGPGKCLGGPPGVTLLAVTARAWEHIAANPDTPRDSVLSLLDWKDAWRRTSRSRSRRRWPRSTRSMPRSTATSRRDRRRCGRAMRWRPAPAAPG
jgi:pyridoxamine--pyruvate transaminase